MRTTRRRLLRSGLGLVGTGLAALGGYHYAMHIEPAWLKIEHVRVPLPIPSGLEGFRIALLSDFHLYPHIQVEHIRRAVDLANRLKPDLALLTGDYVDSTASAVYDLAPELARLDAKFGIYSILGNHDLWTDADLIRVELERQGLPVLVNRALTLNIGRERLVLAGLDDTWSGHPDLRVALAQAPSDLPTIVMMHEPDLADTLSLDGRVSLQLSGHSHGGQVRLPRRGAPVLPYLGSKYDAGLYRVRDMWVYTTRGVGVVGPPVRLNCRPEVTEITLIAGAPQAG